MSKKLTYEYVKKQYEKEGYELLSTKYIKAIYKLKIKCIDGHIYEASYDKFKQGRRCPICYRLIKGNEYRLLYDDVKEEIEKENYKLLSRNYKNYNSKLRIKCNKKHEFYMSIACFKRGHRCSICHIENNSGENHYNWKGGISCEPYCEQWKDKEYKESIKERDGYKCLNPECSKKVNILDIHHIDYNKKNCHPLNLITICRSCNAKANKDRRWHKAWYTAIIKNRYI